MSDNDGKDPRFTPKVNDLSFLKKDRKTENWVYLFWLIRYKEDRSKVSKTLEVKTDASTRIADQRKRLFGSHIKLEFIYWTLIKFNIINQTHIWKVRENKMQN